MAFTSKAEVKSRGTFREDQTRSASTSRTSNACLNNAETQEALQTHAAIMVSTNSIYCITYLHN
jgi:hypothetical protein